jgi:UDP-N-acetyl-D-mannosaminuronate dehydrogenase
MNEGRSIVAFLSQTKKIAAKKSHICVIALEQVALTASLSFLKEGFKVVDYDVSEKRVQNPSMGITYIPEKGFNELAAKFQQYNSFTLTTSPDVLSNAEILVICVPTSPYSIGPKADHRYLKKVSRRDYKTFDGQYNRRTCLGLSL